MALTKLDSAMVSIPASINDLKTFNLSATFVSADEVKTNIAKIYGEAFFFGKITALSGLEVVSTDVTTTSALSVEDFYVNEIFANNAEIQYLNNNILNIAYDRSTVVQNTSGNWNLGYQTGTQYALNSASLISSRTVVQNTSGNWNNAYTNVQSNSSKWESLNTIFFNASTDNTTPKYIYFGPGGHGVDALDGYDIAYNSNAAWTRWFANLGNAAISGINEPFPNNPLIIYPNEIKKVQWTGTGPTFITLSAFYFTNSQKWDTAYSLVQANSATWEESLEILPTVTNYLSTNNVTLSALTITNSFSGFNSLTVSGNISGNNLRTSFNQGSATGNYSFAEGQETIASGQASHAEGFETTASGNFGSHAEGSRTTASGNRSHAEGEYTVASGLNSHAEGSYTEAYGTRSHAEGFRTVAADYGHAAGYRATAAQDYTYAWTDGNLGTLTENVPTTRTGQYMVSASGGVFIPGNLGIGTDSNANALTVRGSISASALTVSGNISATGNILAPNQALSENDSVVTRRTGDLRYGNTISAIFTATNVTTSLISQTSALTAAVFAIPLEANSIYDITCNVILSSNNSPGGTKFAYLYTGQLIQATLNEFYGVQGVVGNAAGGATNVRVLAICTDTNTLSAFPPNISTSGIHMYNRSGVFMTNTAGVLSALYATSRMPGNVVPYAGSSIVARRLA